MKLSSSISYGLKLLVQTAAVVTIVWLFFERPGESALFTAAIITLYTLDQS